MLQGIMKDKETFLEKFKETKGIISSACDAVGISRMTFYRWKKDDPEFADKCNEIEEASIDYVESKLIENIDQNKTSEILFYLKTKGKNRGYVERQEIQTDGFPDKIQIEVISNEDTDQ
jgi:predicted DNA-binding transcriptional regulator AlpA